MGRPIIPPRLGTTLATTAALVAFAANSILCRAALQGGAIDPFAFSLLRVASGAGALLLIVSAADRARRPLGAAPPRGGSASSGRSGFCPASRLPLDWTSGAMLALYAVAFSWAYTRLSTGTGALVLFATVQATIVAGALRLGERPRPRQWIGLAVALLGLAILAAPGLAAPSPAGVVAMAAAGTGWGFYTLRGRGLADPLRATAGNFLTALPLVAAATVPALLRLHASIEGALLAVASGALASALGYIAWYGALRGLTATRSAAVQLSVPVLAAAGGIALLGETLTPRSTLAGLVILGGVALAVTRTSVARDRARSQPRSAEPSTVAS